MVELLLINHNFRSFELRQNDEYGTPLQGSLAKDMVSPKGRASEIK
jgi:hypothetical protein